MPDWANDPADENHLRLFLPGEGWKAYADKLSDEDGKLEASGSKRLIESAFLNALNSTNLLILTGSGSSLAARNDPAKAQPASMGDLWKAVKLRAGETKFLSICGLFPSAPIDGNIEKLLTLCKLYLELNQTSTSEEAKSVATFVREAEDAILLTVDFIDGQTTLDAHATVIQKIGRRGMRKPRARFFTTNYDLCFEEAARRHRFTIIDGFSHALEQTYDRANFDFDIVRREIGKDAPDYIENVFHLYKLHGSVDWRRIEGEIVRSKSPKGDPILIYPRSSKYQESFEAPYLDMIGALQASLRESDTALIISGFGFNDDHLSRPILAAMEANMSLRLLVCDPAFLDAADVAAGDHVLNADLKTQNKYLKAFYRLAEGGDPRVHLLNGRFSDMAKALPDLVGETDRERHIARVRALREEQPH
ncbi:SIR2 family protein [Brevundimonas sp. PAMC22021]|uniref:SIR2 family protein n=1 Tax=Brevundimonas sp. PAMC22021 TaxID=2861285 RepID=UPI001C6269FD|nr:SIR2 family protein [Brevundimonas sp. PAMC22021]QYF86217.1 SIR2 family protein [Brevundimonas sp. PAMC22021]